MTKEDKTDRTRTRLLWVAGVLGAIYIAQTWDLYFPGEDGWAMVYKIFTFALATLLAGTVAFVVLLIVSLFAEWIWKRIQRDE